MTTFVIFDLLHGRPALDGYCQPGSVADIGKGGGLLGGIGALEEFHERRMI